ncbi:MAG TPA: methionine aminotransferase [Pseudomonadales bacterium]|nr:methionine aminotransferase [Pseudomonadales bacterium]
MKPAIVSRLPDVGTTIFTVMSQKAEQYGALNLSQGFPDFPLPPALAEALARSVAAGHNQYAPMAGLPRLRECIAADLEQHFGCRADPLAEVTVVPGATEAIFCAIMASVRAGDEVILFDPSYDSYEPSVRLAGARAVRIPLAQPDFTIDWQRVEAAIGPRTRLVVINSPHNPSGSVLARKDLDRLGELAEQHDLLVLSDEVYAHLVYDGARHHSVLAHPLLAPRSFAVFSFGKTYHVTGWKTGYCVAPAPLTTELRRVHQFVTFTAVTPIQHALADFMQSDPQHVAALPAFYQARRDLFCQALAGSRWKLAPSAGTYFQLLDYAAISDVDDLGMAERLVSRHGIAAIPVSVFYEQPPARGLLRFCFAKQEQTLLRAAEVLCTI